MNQGLLVVLALLLIYLAVTGRYSCVTAASKCVFGGEKLCACGPQAQGQAQAGQTGPNIADPITTTIRRTKDTVDKVRGGIEAVRDAIRGRGKGK